jgi:hypothetical protein
LVWARTFRLRPATSEGVLALVDGVPDAARAVSHGLLRERPDGRIDNPGAGWKGRASTRRFDASAIPHGRRQRTTSKPREVPDAAGSAG